MGMRGCINYNPVLAIRQLGYPMKGVSLEESTMPFISWGFKDPNARIFQRVRKAWSAAQRKDMELRGSSNGIIGMPQVRKRLKPLRRVRRCKP